MRLDGWLRLVRIVGRRGDVGRQGAIALVALAERMLGPTLVNAAIVTGTARAFAVGVLLSSVFALRGLLQTTQVARTEVRLYTRVVDSALKKDVLQPSVLPDEEARAILFEGAHSVASFLAEGIPNLCANTIAAAIFTGYVLVMQPRRIVLVVALAGAAGALLFALSRRAIDAAERAESSAWMDLADGVNDAFDGRLEIVAGGHARAYAATFAEIVTVWSKATMHTARVSRLVGRLPMLALVTAVGAAVVLESLLRGEPAAKTLGQAAFLASMTPAFVGAAHGLQEIARGDRRFRQMLALVTVDAPTSRAGVPPPGNVHSVVLRDVHFTYQRSGPRQEALRGISVTWVRGEVLALAGPNGSGKSTCLRLLLGLGQPTTGEVLIDGLPLRKMDLDPWRRSIAFLPQRPYLPPRATVRECLRFVDRDVADEAMLRALDRVGLTRVLEGQGSSPLEARVDELSIGQRQRVGLARVLCRRAPILMLDEPDANLDQAGVQLVAELLRELGREQMVIVAAHSPMLLAAADKVLRLELGRVSEESGVSKVKPVQ
jgi:ABC-type multidrug transport system fused ATPase/permease subunit